MAHALNDRHKVQYFSEPDPLTVLDQVMDFLEDGEAGRFNTLQMQIAWDEESNKLRYEGYLIHGGW